MPRALEPGGRFPVVLGIDKDKTPQPTFWSRHLSVREWRRVASLADGEGEEAAKRDRIGNALAALEETLVDWENIVDPKTNKPIAFNVAEIDNVLEINEVSELVFLVLAGDRLSVADKKKSDSPA